MKNVFDTYISRLHMAEKKIWAWGFVSWNLQN